MDEEDTLDLKPTARELAAVGMVVQMYLELVGVGSLPEGMILDLESFAAKVIQALESTTYNGG